MIRSFVLFAAVLHSSVAYVNWCNAASNKNNVICVMYSQMRDVLSQSGLHIAGDMNKMMEQTVRQYAITDDTQSEVAEQVKDEIYKSEDKMKEMLKDYGCGDSGRLKHQMDELDMYVEHIKYERRCPHGCVCRGSLRFCGNQIMMNAQKPDGMDDEMMEEKPMEFCPDDTLPFATCKGVYDCSEEGKCPNGFFCHDTKYENGTATNMQACCNPNAEQAVQVFPDHMNGSYEHVCWGGKPAKKDDQIITDCDSGTKCPDGHVCMIAGPTDRICCHADDVVPAEYEIIPLLSAETDTPGNTAKSMNAQAYLIKSEMMSMVVDMGRPDDIFGIDQALKANDVYTCDIGCVIQTHDHADHTGTSVLFGTRPILSWSGSMIYHNTFWKTPLTSEDDNMVLCPNSEVKLMAGHTDHDKSVWLYNIKDIGSAVISGDIVKNSEEASVVPDNELLAINRKQMVCFADVIYPGHGEMFQVTEDMRNAQGC